MGKVAAEKNEEAERSERERGIALQVSERTGTGR